MRNIFLLPENCNNSCSPERADFAREAAADAFGHHFPAAGSDGFRDRLPDAEVPEVAALRFKRGKHRRLPSWRSAG